MFGGDFSYNSAETPLWILDIGELMFSQGKKKIDGTKPWTVRRSAVDICKRGKWSLSFGLGGTDSLPAPLLMTAFLYVPGARRWRKPVYGEVVTPCGVRGHTAVVCNNAMHVYGGYQDLKGSTGQMWTFDLGKFTFSTGSYSLRVEPVHSDED